MNKTLAFKMPAKPAEERADAWIDRGIEDHLKSRPAAQAERTVRFTFDVSASLHLRVKMACAQKSLAAGKTVTMVDEVRRLLEEEFPAP